MVSAPERGPPEFAATLDCTVPLPLPLAPEATVSHGTVLAAVQSQPAPAVTETLPVPPPDGGLAAGGRIESVQPLPWLTVKV